YRNDIDKSCQFYVAMRRSPNNRYLCAVHIWPTPLEMTIRPGLSREHSPISINAKPMDPASPSNASIPGAAAFSVKVPAVCDDDSRKIFGVFPAELTPEPKAD